jgi:hypothetical protein
LLQDLRRMAALLGRPLERYGTIAVVRADHTEMVVQINRRPQVIVPRPRPVPPPPSRLRARLPDTWPSPPFPGSRDGTIVPISSLYALEREGKSMHHCAAAYAPLIELGSSYLYRVLEPERATAELRMDGREWQLWQLRGRGNRPVSMNTQCTVEAWLMDMRRHIGFGSLPRRVWQSHP